MELTISSRISFHGLNHFDQNNQSVIDAINIPKVGNKALSIVTYDFSALYSNKRHNKLKNVMRKLITFCFKGGRKQYIIVAAFSATWTDDKN